MPSLTSVIPEDHSMKHITPLISRTASPLPTPSDGRLPPALASPFDKQQSSKTNVTDDPKPDPRNNKRRESKSLFKNVAASFLTKSTTNLSSPKNARPKNSRPTLLPAGALALFGRQESVGPDAVRKEMEAAEAARKDAAIQKRLLENIRMGRNVSMVKKKAQDGARSFGSLLPDAFWNIITGGAGGAVNKSAQVRVQANPREQSFREKIQKSESGRLESGRASQSGSLEDSLKGGQSSSGRRRFSINEDLIKSNDVGVPKSVDANGEWAIHPQDKNYYRWFVFTLFLVIYNSVNLPLDLMFYDSDVSFGPTFYFETMIDFVFMADIWITFRTGYIDDNDNVICSRSLIAARYFKGSFVVDTISSLPFDLFVLFASDEAKKDGQSMLFQYLALAKTFRLLRIGRLAKYMSDLGMVSFIRIIRILFIYLLFAHWGGCVFYLLMKNRSNNKHDTWIEATVADSYKSDDYPLAKFELKGCGETATVVEENRETCFDFPEMSQYWMVMYASMMIMMGDSIDCKNNYETVYAVGMSLVGACLTAMMFGQMAHIVAGMDAEDTRYEELMGHVRDQVSQLDLLPETRERVVDYYEFQWRINSGMDRQQFLGSLSPCLRIEILLSVYADIVGKISFLHVPDCPEFICYIVERLVTAFYLPSDVIVHEGELTSAWSFVYFLTLGQTAVYTAEQPGEIIHQMNEGDYFGEMAYLDVGSRRTTSVCALSNCDIALLKFGDIDDLADSFPAFQQNIMKLMKRVPKKMKGKQLQRGRVEEERQVEKVASPAGSAIPGVKGRRLRHEDSKLVLDPSSSSPRGSMRSLSPRGLVASAAGMDGVINEVNAPQRRPRDSDAGASVAAPSSISPRISRNSMNLGDAGTIKEHSMNLGGTSTIAGPRVVKSTKVDSSRETPPGPTLGTRGGSNGASPPAGMGRAPPGFGGMGSSNRDVMAGSNRDIGGKSPPPVGRGISLKLAELAKKREAVILAGGSDEEETDSGEDLTEDRKPGGRRGSVSEMRKQSEIDRIVAASSSVGASRPSSDSSPSKKAREIEVKMVVPGPRTSMTAPTDGLLESVAMSLSSVGERDDGTG